MHFSTNFYVKDCKGPFPPSEACRQLCLRVNLVHAGRRLSFMQNHSRGLCSTATQDTLDVYFTQCTTQLEVYSSHNSKLPLEKRRGSPQWRNYSLLLIIFEQANGANFHQAIKHKTSRKYKKYNQDAVIQRSIRYS